MIDWLSGTGLHTFVLYLGPHIARYTLATNECGTIMVPTFGSDAFMCPDDADHDNSDVTLIGIMSRVQVACFLWGLGTAIGELPPYFVSRAGKLVRLVFSNE